MTDERPILRPRKLGPRGLLLISALEGIPRSVLSRENLDRVAALVDDFIDATPTTQAQFDALVSWQYRWGAISSSKLGQLHKAGDYAGAAREFFIPAERRLYQS